MRAAADRSQPHAVEVGRKQPRPKYEAQFALYAIKHSRFRKIPKMTYRGEIKYGAGSGDDSAIFLSQRRIDEAIASFTGALGKHKAAGLLYGEARTLKDLAEARAETGDLTEARASLAAAIKIFKQIGDRAGAAEAESLLGALAAKLPKRAHHPADRDDADRSQPHARCLPARLPWRNHVPNEE
jgi:tetratricopeptide (TPR) repeat protein